MRIILSNYRYFISGGPEKYLFAIKPMLEANGHEVLPFSVRSARNVPNPFEKRFLSPIADEHSVYAHEYRKTPMTILRLLSRQFYCPEAFLKARAFADFARADIAYSLQFMNKMSPAVLDGFKSRGLPVVLRVSDFSLICPQGHLFDGEQVCQLCLGGGFGNAVCKRCVNQSVLGSSIKAAALAMHRLLRCRDRIDAFAFPARFTLERFAEAGFPREKLHLLPTFTDASRVEPSYGEGGHILYFGRFVVEKGVHHLLQAYSTIRGDKPKLVLVGGQGETEYARSLQRQLTPDMELHEFMTKEELAGHIRASRCVVIPSIWYDNLPNVLLEAYAHGKPVIAPDHGCFSELVRDGQTGLLYKAADVGDLREKLIWAMEHPAQLAQLGRKAREHLDTEFSPKAHYDTLMTILRSVLKTSWGG
ncbi:MAG: hypothetical protein FD177_2230 [Desulfovibrionaceae bacterium]|nr:MAG: hypothetical protein FD177_2230 [Desulfovibrionaceae bacterium]